MYNLFDIMQAAQGGYAMNNLAKQFNLSQEQTQRAIEAVLPAFSIGLMRNAQNPLNFASTLGMMGSGQFAPFFDQPAATQSSSAMAQGNNVLTQVFGSPEVSRQVAAHAGVLSGVSTEVLVRMMPVIGALIMGGLFKAAMSQGFGGLLTQMSEMMQKGGFPAGPFGLPQPKGGMRAEPTPEAETAAGPSGDVFGKLFADMLSGMLGGARPDQAGPQGAAAPKGKPRAASAGAPPIGDAPPFDPAQFGLDQISRMFETGRAVQQQQVEAMQSIFDALLNGRR